MSIVLAVCLAGSASAQIIQPESVQLCGEALYTDEVMVLDLRSFGGRDPGGEAAFIRKHAGHYVPAHKNLLTVLIAHPAGPTEVDVALSQSQIEAAKRGCDLVLVYHSEIRNASNNGGWYASADVKFATRTR